MVIDQAQSRPRLALGMIVATPGALAVLERAGVAPVRLLRRHAAGDWGDLDTEDWQANERAIRDGERVLSAYPVGDTERVWVITEWNRSVSARTAAGRVLSQQGDKL